VKRPGLVVVGVVALLLVLIGQLAYSVSQESLSWDEGDHIYAGYMSWKHDFGLNPEHPPLVKAVAAIPLLSMNLTEPPLHDRYFKTEAYLNGRDLIFNNNFYQIIFRARLMASIFAVLLALVVFFAVREMFGLGAAFIALVLVVFEPNLLAHGAMVTTDTGIACFLIATIYAFYRYIKKPSLWRVAVLGIAAGLAAVAKHSAILLLPMVGLLAIGEIIRRRNFTAAPEAGSSETRGRQALRLGLAMVAATAIAVVFMWAIYGFRYQARPAGRQMNPPLAEAVKGVSPFEGKVITAFANRRLLPESWLYGLADVRAVANIWPSYMFGKVYAHGVWFYFPVILLMKPTLGLLLLLLLTAVAIAMGKFRCWREILYLSIPPLIYLLVSMQSMLNIGARHVLLVFMFGCMLTAGGAWSLIRADRRWAYVVVPLILFHVLSSAMAFPTSYMAYSNELWGGPSATYKYVTDSSTDWGQQLIGTKKYLDQRGVKECWFAYFVQPAIEFQSYGIPCKPIPTPDSGFFGEQIDVPPTITGPVLISASDLTGYEYGSNVLNPYREFQKLRPTAVIERGVFVFDGTFNVPMASALGHAQRARTLLGGQKLDEALSEAQAAVVLAPDAMQSQMAMGDVLTAMQRGDEAHSAYQKAMVIAKIMEPSAQEIWVAEIQKKLGAK
jgi:hypothetical protein